MRGLLSLSLWTFLWRFTLIASAEKCTKAPHMPGVDCGLQGLPRKTVYKYDAEGDPSDAKSVGACALLCARHEPSCESFEYNPYNQSCQFFLVNAARVHDPASNNASRPRTYSDRKCYQCFGSGNGCSISGGQPYRSQLLDNGGFESPKIGPWEAQKVSVATPGKNSQHRAVVRGDKWALYQTFKVCSSSWYETRFDYTFEHEDASGGSVFAYMEETPNVAGFTFSPQGSAVNGTWGRGSLMFKGKDQYGSFNDGISFLSDLTQNNNALSIDNVQVERRPDPKPLPTGSPPGFNGGFETGQGDPWKLGSYYVYPDLQDPQSLTQNVTSPGLAGSKYALSLAFEKFKSSVAYLATSVQGLSNNHLYLLQADFQNGLLTEGNQTSPIIVGFNLYSEGVISSSNYFFVDSDEAQTVKSQPLFAQKNSADVVVTIFLGDAYPSGVLTLDNIILRPMHS